MKLSRALLSWYDRERRHLAWRADSDPYRIWVSEVMLQQTRVEAVVPYYQAFIERFPTVEDLAAAGVEEVLALWSGLGYYRRARLMHRAAKKIRLRGTFPRSSLELLEMPGIGPYTAAAVASMAFGECVPVLDGNVERVICRRLGIEENPKRSSVRKKLVDGAARLLDPVRPGDSNQALMELGATICRPKRPNCGSCPIRPGCLAERLGDPERFSRPRQRRVIERVDLAVAVVRQRGRVLLFRRPEDSRVLPGMWELPNVAHCPSREKIEKSLGRRYGGRWRLDPVIGLVQHSITYRAIYIQAHSARLLEGGDDIGGGLEAAWVLSEEGVGLPISSMVEKILTLEG